MLFTNYIIYIHLERTTSRVLLLADLADGAQGVIPINTEWETFRDEWAFPAKLFGSCWPIILSSFFRTSNDFIKIHIDPAMMAESRNAMENPQQLPLNQLQTYKSTFGVASSHHQACQSVGQRDHISGDLRPFCVRFSGGGFR